MLDEFDFCLQVRLSVVDRMLLRVEEKIEGLVDKLKYCVLTSKKNMLLGAHMI